MRFLFVFGNILVLGGLLVAVISGVAVVNESLQRHPLGFLAFWAFIPAVSWWLTWEPPADEMSSGRFPAEKQSKNYTSNYIALKTFTSFLVGSACLLSFLIFLNWEGIRDHVGEHYVQGYFVTHDVEITENGPQRVSNVYAEHRYAERAMWLFEVSLWAGIFGFPLLTLILTQRCLESHPWREGVQPRQRSGQF